MLAKAKTSCLTAADVKVLQFEPYEENHELEIYPKFAGFKIPYFKLDGKVDPEFYRFRLLQTQPSKGFAAITEEPKKPRRYTQPTTDCGVYLPPLLGENWAAIAKDAAVELVITEGELKAACACKLGLACLGIGGVYNWRSAKNNQDLLPILDKFIWMGRKVVICFDSDMKDNPMVRMAASRLAYTLAMRGALVFVADLPETIDADGNPKKQGLDDFIYGFVMRAVNALSVKATAKTIERAEAAGAEEGLDEFGRLLVNAVPIGPGQELHRLNVDVALIRSTAEIIELNTGSVFTPNSFSDARYRNRTYNERSDENGKMVKKFAAKEWLAWGGRTEVTELAYDPACNNMITGEGAYNTWYAQKWPLTPSKKGSIAPWERLFQHVIGASLSPEQQLWVRQWFAYPIQKPGTKLSTALLVWSRQQGNGKTMLGQTMATIYGRNYGTVTNMQLAGQFSEWAKDKQFIVGDEISLGDKRGLANTLKDMITRETLTMNIKNRKTYPVRDCINYYFTSQKEDALYIESADRRFFIVHAERDALPEQEYTKYKQWLYEEGGAERLMWYFQNEVDLAGFNPYGRAPMTTAKLEMAVAGRSEIEDWACDLIKNTDSILRPDRYPQDLWRTEDLLAILDPDKRGKAGNKALSAALSNAGAFKIANGQNGAIINGNRSRLWAVRNIAAYKKMGAAEAGRIYESERPQVYNRVGESQKFSAGKRLQ
jgi:hypothetical protein